MLALNGNAFSEHVERILVDTGVKVQRFSSGEPIFTEGDPGDSAFFVRTGSVDIVGQGPSGEERLLNRVGKGELFGEMALLDQTRRSASARAREAVELCVVTRDEIIALLQQRPQMALWMLELCSRRLRVLTRMVTQMEEVQEVNLRILSGQEEERRRIGRDIHDGIAQSFADSILRVQSAVQLVERDPNRARTALKDVEEGLRDNLERIHELITNLFPRALRSAGLVGAIRQYLDGVAKCDNLQIAFDHRGSEDELPAALEATTFCIVQEAVNNVRKHAQASKVRIDLRHDGPQVTLSVEDDGRGFDPLRRLVESTADNSCGLLSMQERTELADGTMEIDSRPGAGTRLRFLFPARPPRTYP